MCGITGFIRKNGSVDIALFEKMTDILEHRGPDDRGTFYDGNLALGQRRLSILDLSVDGKQPMQYRDRYIITFNGEIFNYIELREELSLLGYVFSTKTDTEVIMAAYDCWGESCLPKFNGMWAFALYDKVKQVLFCSRDRFGVKPFYYYHDHDKFVIASEIKAILPALQSPIRANIPRLLDNIMYGIFDHTKETLFKNIFQIPAGGILTLDCEFNLIENKFYDINEIRVDHDKTYDSNVRIFRDLFVDSVRLRLRSDVPVGSCLSGGLDSSSIVCVSAKLLEGMDGVRHETISSCYKEEDEKAYDEQEFIDEVVKFTEVVSHKVYPKMSDFINNIDKILYHQDEPVGGLCHESQYNVFKSAKEHGLTVMLDGQGADEQLAGYSAFHSAIVREYLKDLNFISAYKEIRAFRHNNTHLYGYKGLLWFMVKDLLPLSVRKRLLKLISSREEFEWLTVAYDDKDVNRVLSYKNFEDCVKKSMKYGLVMLLHYEDRNSMAWSIEGRVPFLDYRLVEHIVSMPAAHKLYHGKTKRVLRDAMKDVIPDKIRNRSSKLGFAVPSDLWIMKHPEMVRIELENALDALAPIFDKAKVLAWFDKNSSNKIALTNILLWRLICTGRWIKIFNVSS